MAESVGLHESGIYPTVVAFLIANTVQVVLPKSLHYMGSLNGIGGKLPLANCRGDRLRVMEGYHKY